MNRSMIRHGFVLMLLALVGGFFVPAMEIPRLAVSAHTIGVLSGVLLIAVGAIWSQFTLGPRQAGVMYWGWLYAGYANWLGCLLGAATGAGRMTPVAAAGLEGTPVAETMVAFLLISVGVVSLVAAGLSLWGLRGNNLSAT